MSTLMEIEAAVDGLPTGMQRELFRRLESRVRDSGRATTQLPSIPATGRPITQKEIDDALDTD